MQAAGGTGERASEQRAVPIGEGISASDGVMNAYRVTSVGFATLTVMTLASLGESTAYAGGAQSLVSRL